MKTKWTCGLIYSFSKPVNCKLVSPLKALVLQTLLRLIRSRKYVLHYISGFLLVSIFEYKYFARFSILRRFVIMLSNKILRPNIWTAKRRRMTGANHKKS